MSIRRGFRRGRNLVIDEESGLTRYSDQITKDYYGRIITKKYADWAHPQDFVRAKNDPFIPQFINAPTPTGHVCVSVDQFIGNTNIPSPQNPLRGMFELEIPDMEIGCSFIVY